MEDNGCPTCISKVGVGPESSPYKNYDIERLAWNSALGLFEFRPRVLSYDHSGIFSIEVQRGTPKG